MRLGIADLETVHSILKHPEVYPHIRDDFSVPVEEYSTAETLACNRIYFLLPVDGCLFIFAPVLTGSLYEGHFAALPESRGGLMTAAGKLAIDWMFCYTPCERMIWCIHQDNLRAIRSAERMGLQHKHTLLDSMRLNGELGDLIVMEIGKRDGRLGQEG
jgi:hypothetical protein